MNPKLYLPLALLVLGLPAPALAQQPQYKTLDPYAVREVETIPDEIKMVRGDKLRAYRLVPEVGRTARVQMPDTLTHYTYEYISPEYRSLGVSYQGNMSSLWQSKYFFARPQGVSDFFYVDGYYGMLYTPSEVRFYDTKTPFTLVRYQKNFATNEAEDVLAADFGVNLGRRLNLGVNFDYRNALGYYTYNRSKDARYRVFTSYRGDRYELYAYVANDYYKQEENGGITNADYINNPERYTNGRTRISAKDVPVLLDRNLHNLQRLGHAFLAQTYRFGSYQRRAVRIPTPSTPGMVVGSDSLQVDSLVFVPVAGLSLTNYYTKHSRQFKAESPSEAFTKAFGPPVVSHKVKAADGTETDLTMPNDSAQLATLRTTVALSLLEGFRPWVKFGLSAYLRQENRWVKNPDLALSAYAPTHHFSSTFVGGLIERAEGTGLNFSARAELGVLGADLGALKLEGDLRTSFRLFRKRFALSADAYLDNARPSYFAAHHHGTYGWWDQDLKFTRRVELGGKIDLSSWGTRLEARTASLQNHLYIDAQGQVQQHGDLIQVLMLRAGQGGKVGPFNWDLEAAFQQSSASSVLPLPSLLVAGDVYLRFLVASVMRIDLGVKGYWHSAYYAPYYQPAHQQFALQTEGRVGGQAPLLNAYANLRLKRARFFFQMYNVGEALFSNERLSMYKYPYAPMHLAAGVVVDLNN